MLCLSNQLYLWCVFYNSLYWHLNKLIKGIKLLSYKTFLIKVGTDNNPASLLPQISGDLITVIFSLIVVGVCKKMGTCKWETLFKVQTAWIWQKSPRFFMSADDQLNCPLIWAILKPQGAVAGKIRRTDARTVGKILVVLVWPKP